MVVRGSNSAAYHKVILPYGLGALIVWLGAMVGTYFDADLKTLAIVLVISGVATCAAMVVLMQRMLPIALDIRRWLAGSAMLIIFCSDGYHANSK